jgi:nucleoid-associated protein YgaU
VTAAGRRTAPLLGALGLLALATSCWHLGRGTLPPPPVGNIGELATWAEELGPVGTTMALVQLATAATAAWLGIAMLAHLAVGAVAPSSPLRRQVARLVPATARHAVGLLAGAGLGSASIVSVATPVLASDPPATASLREVVPPAPGDGPAVAVLRSIDATAEDGADHPRAPDDDPAQHEVDPGHPDREPGAALEVWSVERGESFWSIAAEVLADRWGRPPTDGEVTPYWRALVEANADRLVTGDPDLLYAGQVLVLPDVP